MALTPQAIRNNITITFNGLTVTKQQILDFSKDWDQRTENFFRKMLKLGGKFDMKGVDIVIKVKEKVFNSKGVKDSGVIVYPGLDSRF